MPPVIHWMESYVSLIDNARIYTRDNIGKPLLTIFFPDDRALQLDGSERKSLLTIFLDLVGRLYHPEWTEISLEEAQKNPLYGRGGVLRLLYLGFFVAMLGAADAAIPAALGVFSGGVSFLAAIPAVLALALQLPFLYLTRRRDPRMPDIAIFCSWLAYSIAVGMAFARLGLWEGLSLFAGGIITIDFFALYLRRSKRVNVTCMLRVRASLPKPSNGYQVPEPGEVTEK